jgi:hypothetical protein
VPDLVILADFRLLLQVFHPIIQEAIMIKKICVVFISLLAVILSGCTTITRIGDFTIVSSKNIDLTRGADFKRGTNRVKGEDIVVIAFTPATPNMKTAIDRAIESVPGAVALLDGVVSQRQSVYFFYSKMGYIVEGTPLIDPALLSNSIPTPALVDPRKRPAVQPDVPPAAPQVVPPAAPSIIK